MIIPAYICSPSLCPEVTTKPISGGVILDRLSGDEKKSHALSRVVGKNVSYLSSYVFTKQVTVYAALKF
jgi:hypothetical protein